jgi:sarcinarray family protein
MKTRWLLVGLIICSIMLSSIAYAKNQYYGIDGVYYNDEQVIGDAAKPNLKIGEPFSLRVDVIAYQECKMDIELNLIDKTHFDFIDGPANFNQYASYIFEANETHTFEWTLKPTDKWAGGEVPLDIYYVILVPNEHGPVANGGFLHPTRRRLHINHRGTQELTKLSRVRYLRTERALPSNTKQQPIPALLLILPTRHDLFLHMGDICYLG